MAGEVPGPQSEVSEKAQEQEAQKMLSPEQRVMSEARVAILGPLDRVELSAVEKETVGKYADKVGELAGQELERLRRESPLRKIVAAMEEYLPVDVDRPGEKAKSIQSIASMAEDWQKAVREEQGVALLQRRPTSPPEIINRLWDRTQESGFEGSAARRIFPTGGTIFGAIGPEQKGPLNQFLRRLDVLPEGTDVDTPFRLPVSGWNYNRNANEISQAIQEGKPTRLLGGETVVGLKSDQLPGVDFRVDRYMDRFIVQVHFTSEAIARATTDIPGIE